MPLEIQFKEKYAGTLPERIKFLNSVRLVFSIMKAAHEVII